MVIVIFKEVIIKANKLTILNGFWLDNTAKIIYIVKCMYYLLVFSKC